MTHGIHKGMLMKDVPAAYLLNLTADKTITGLTEYVADNHEILILEAKRDERLQSQKRMARR